MVEVAGKLRQPFSSCERINLVNMSKYGSIKKSHSDEMYTWFISVIDSKINASKKAVLSTSFLNMFTFTSPILLLKIPLRQTEKSESINSKATFEGLIKLQVQEMWQLHYAESPLFSMQMCRWTTCASISSWVSCILDFKVSSGKSH